MSPTITASPPAVKIHYGIYGVDKSITRVILVSMKTAISIPDHVFKSAEQLAKRLGKSRSSLYAEAVSSYVDEHQKDGVTEALNSIYENEESRLNAEIADIQAESITEEIW